MTLTNMHPAYWLEPWIDWIGVLLASLGLVGMYWARLHMGQLWLPGTGVKYEHRIIDRGLYSIVRHPIYTFVIIFYLGSVLVFPVWWNWAAFLVAIAGYIYKALEEETFLLVHLPGYSEYQHRVHFRLIPGIW